MDNLNDDGIICIIRYITPRDWSNLLVTSKRLSLVHKGWNYSLLQIFPDSWAQLIISLDLSKNESWLELIYHIYDLPIRSEIGYSFGSESLSRPKTALSLLFKHKHAKRRLIGHSVGKNYSNKNFEIYISLISIIIPEQRELIIPDIDVVELSKKLGIGLLDNFLDFIEWMHYGSIVYKNDHYYQPQIYDSYAQDVLASLIFRVIQEDYIEALRKIYARFNHPKTVKIPKFYADEYGKLLFINYAFGMSTIDPQFTCRSDCGLYLLSLPESTAVSLLEPVLCFNGCSVSDTTIQSIINHASITSDDIINTSIFIPVLRLF